MGWASMIHRVSGFVKACSKMRRQTILFAALTSFAPLAANACQPLASECDTGIESISVADAVALVPSPSLALSLRLPAVVHRLDSERAAQRGALQRAATARGQALAARRLAAAYADAAAALRRVAGAPGASLIEHLAGVRRAYGALARAAAAGSVGAFAATSRAVRRAEAGLTRAIAAVPGPITAEPG